jgi:hypothetical protein
VQPRIFLLTTCSPPTPVIPVSAEPTLTARTATTASSSIDFDFDGIDEGGLFPEVRASVSSIDDPEMPTFTIWMWCIGLTLCTVSRHVSSSPSS